jgi:UDP-N-acetylmuramoyl-L-alanyl-D-glutamate--2,6-diaminopimelate ligase
MMAAAIAAMTLGELLGPGAAGLHSNLLVNDLVLDDRQVSAGAAFVAVAGAHDHGLQYADRARARGAAVVLYEPTPDYPSVAAPAVAVPGLKQRLGDLARRFYAREYGTPKLAGVTGTNGKTTVAYVLAQAMQGLGRACAYIGTLGFGIPPSMTKHTLTTPDCLTLHRELAALATPFVALEASSHALEQDRVAGLAFETALFTNLTRDHLDQHGDMASYGRAKQRLFTRPEIRAAVINRDDPYSQVLLGALAAGVRVIGTSLRNAAGAELAARFAPRGLDGMTLEIEGSHGKAALDSPFVGKFNAENLLVVLGALLAWDVTLEDGCAALAQCVPPPGRMEILGGGRAPHVVVDYAHTPDALERVLAALRELSAGEVWCVFGCGGERDRGKRPLMGGIAARYAQHIVLTDDNPRTEDPAAIVADIRAGLAGHASVVIEHDREIAIARAVRAASSGDVVLVAGKGHETVQTIGKEMRPFDDRVAVAAALRGS